GDNSADIQQSVDVGDSPATDVAQQALVNQSNGSGSNASHIDQGVSQRSKSPDSGGVQGQDGHQDGGVWQDTATGNNRSDADKSVSLSQRQIGPLFCCSEQQSNPDDVFRIDQRSSQQADDGATQFNSGVGNCDSSGTCFVTQRVQQGNTVTTNSCTGSSCHTGIVCGEGGCAPCTVEAENCPSPPGDGCEFECSCFTCDFSGA